MDLGLTDRVYVVTGASRGLGLACARQLVSDGAQVVMNSRDEAALSAAADSLEAPDRVLVVPGDIGAPGTDGRLVAAAVGRFGRVDGALISVGGPPPGRVMDLDEDTWKSAFGSVFLGPLRVARAVARAASGEGASVVFVLSTSVRQPVDGLALSNGLRPGLAMVAKSLADELAADNVRVNGVLPGRIDTDRARELDEASGRPAAVRRDREAAIPMGRYGQPDELARPAVFLLSPAASYITGTMLPVDGGASRSL